MKYVLFVCNHNAGRSQMAQAFLERLAPADVRAESAGSTPARQIWPNVIQAMREVGIDIAQRRPQKLTLEMQLHADWAVQMGCGEACPYVPTQVEDWHVPDPADQPITVVRDVRDEVQQRVRSLVAERLDVIRADRTAHQFRLAQLLPGLVAEFEGSHTPEDIRACADAVLNEFDGVPVRRFVIPIVQKRVRSCLRAEECVATAT